MEIRSSARRGRHSPRTYRSVPWESPVRHHARHAGIAVRSAALCLLAGCTVGPDFTPPSKPQTLAYTRDEANQLPSPSDGEVAQHLDIGRKISANWWTLFRSPAVDELIKQALANNRTLAAAQATLGQSQQAVLQAMGAYYPQVSLGANASRQKQSLAPEGIETTPAIFNLYSVGPTASFSLDPFGLNRRRVEQQAALAEAQEYQLDAAYLSLTGNLVMEAITIAAVNDEIAAVDEIIANDERTLQSVRTETNAGELTRIDVDSAESQLASDRTLAPPLRQERNAAEDALALLMGKAPADWTPPTLHIEQLDLPQDLPLSLPSELVHERPDVLTREAQLHAASAAIGVATAQLYPNITLSASTVQEALTPAHLFQPMSNLWSIAGALTAPIFEGGALEAQRQGAKKGFEAALAEYEQTVLQSFSQVADVLHSLAHDAELVREQRHALEVADRSLRHVRAAFGFGHVSLLQVLDAQRQFAQARLGLIRAKAQRHRDTVQLFVAMGGDWREWREAAMAQHSSDGDARPVSAISSR